ncbi:MAG: RodZ domain-containing protein [Pseudomonadota bacterium]
MTEEEMPDQAETAAETEVEAETGASAGEMLRAAREQQDISAADVARHLRLAVRQIEALEADDFERLPGNTFVRGFIRHYARLVHLDPEPVLRAYDAARPQQPAQGIEAPSRDITFTPEGSEPRFKLKQAAIGLGVLALAAGALYWIFLMKGRQPPAPREASPEPAQVQLQLPAPPAAELSASQAAVANPPAAASEAEMAKPAEMPPPPPPVVAAQPAAAQPAGATSEAAGARIKMVFSGDSWVEIRDKEGKKIFSQLNPGGTEQVVQGTPPFSLVVGSASNVRLTYNGKPVDLAPYVKVEVARLTLE